MYEVPGSNLGSKTGYPDCGLLVFLSIIADICRDITYNRPRVLPLLSQLIIH